MRKLIFVGFVATGALIGLLAAAQEGWGTRLIMMAVGVSFAVPLGAVAAKLRPKGQIALDWRQVSERADPTAPKALMENYWRDRGHPPFMKPSDAEPDRHMFDPDRLA